MYPAQHILGNPILVCVSICGFGLTIHEMPASYHGNVQCVQKVTVHLGYGTQIWLSVSKLPLKCAVVSPYSVVKQRLKCNTGKVCNCLIQFLLTMVLSIE
jgi:hypothetical protein